MKKQKTFFTLASTIYKPDDLIQLGQVIEDAAFPFRRVAPPPKLTGKLEPRVSTVGEFMLRDTGTKEVSVSLVGEASGLVGAKLSTRQSRDESLSWGASELETHYFEPDEDMNLITLLRENADVEKFLKKLRPFATAYVVVGIKIAIKPGAITCDTDEETVIEAKIKSLVDLSAAFRIGGGAGTSIKSSSRMSALPLDSYVLAYQLRQITVNPLTGSAKIGQFKQGADLHEERTDDYCTERPENDIVVDSDDFGSDLPRSLYGRQVVGLGEEESYVLLSEIPTERDTTVG